MTPGIARGAAARGALGGGALRARPWLASITRAGLARPPIPQWGALPKNATQAPTSWAGDDSIAKSPDHGHGQTPNVLVVTLRALSQHCVYLRTQHRSTTPTGHGSIPMRAKASERGAYELVSCRHPRRAHFGASVVGKHCAIRVSRALPRPLRSPSQTSRLETNHPVSSKELYSVAHHKPPCDRVAG